MDKSKIFDRIRYNKVIQAKFTNDINHYRKEYLKTEIEIKVKLFYTKIVNLSISLRKNIFIFIIKMGKEKKIICINHKIKVCSK